MKFLILILFFLSTSFLFAEERSPQAEPPYPEYPQPRKTQNPSQREKPSRIDSDGTYHYDNKNSVTAPSSRSGVERPTRVGKDGSYYYDTSDQQEKSKARTGVESPKDIGKDGSYYYSTDKEDHQPQQRAGVEKPSRVKADGTYFYGNQEEKGYNSTFYFNLGALGPFPWSGKSTTSASYEDVYSNQGKLLISGGYEWKMFDFLGALLVRLETGVMFAEGKGQFSGPVNSGLQPRERFQLYLLPNTASVIYKFESSPSQYFIPYLGGGAGYYTFWERRNDDKKNSFGGAPVLTASGGLLVSLKLLNRLFDTDSIDSEYGVNHSWLHLQYQRVIGLDKRKDFSSNMITGGVALGF